VLLISFRIRVMPKDRPVRATAEVKWSVVPCLPAPAGGDQMAVMSAERGRSDVSDQKACVKPPLDPAKREFTTLLKIDPNE